ncbi:MAG: DNA alkylation response protein [Gammaproteobacteria bacterium]|nr:MAG: DNA alkylation response protein [Gammaproteobacteria bacterium]
MIKPSKDLASTTHHARGETHAVENVGVELSGYDSYGADIPLQEAVRREDAAWAEDDLWRFGRLTGSAAQLELGELANRYQPELDTHDRFGRRIDRVRYHDAYHRLMASSLSEGLHATPWRDPRPGAHVARAAKYVLQAQVEAGHGCPITMTFASIPTLRLQPELAARFESKVLACDYDPRNVAPAEKHALTVGMGMTEKQGGSDVRANTTAATPVAHPGAGQPYRLVGHKWFLSAPMCDLFLMLAQAPEGLSCFLVPRWCDNGSKNPLQVIRLKNKMGNQSNASSEVELRGAEGWLVGDEGRGVANIIQMVALTRFDCMIGSSAQMRMAVSQAIHHCSQRRAFGARLVEQPLMANVLADLALEYEAAIALTLRMGRALDRREADEHEALLFRLGTAVGKYWICKRGPQLAYETMECLGGNGVMEDCIMPRLYREAVINPIWEGSGNVQCLDVLRALGRTPAVRDGFVAEIEPALGRHSAYDDHVQRLKDALADPDDAEFRARDLVARMALALQGSILLQHAPTAVAEAFCSTRLKQAGHHFGVLPRGNDTALLIERAHPWSTAA